MSERTIRDRVAITRLASHVAEVRLARPQRRNALDGEMMLALVEAAQSLTQDTTLRAVVLHGEGPAFCAGMDRSHLEDMLRGTAFSVNGAPLGQRTHGAANVPQQAALAWRTLPVPVICAIHGVALGGGLQIALGADLRLVAPDARLALMEIEWGLVPDMAAMWLGRGLIRDDWLRELVYGGQMIGAEEAVRIGLATRVCEHPLADARALADTIAAKNPEAVRAAKRLFSSGLRTIETALLAESREQQSLMASSNQREAVAARLEGRPPTFAGP